VPGRLALCAPALCARPAPARSPAADRGTSPPVASGRQPAGAPSAPALPAPLQASFRFEKLARQVVVTLVRPETQQVVRQIPPEKILRLIAYLREVVSATLDRAGLDRRA